jgi:hypothetical protein
MQVDSHRPVENQAELIPALMASPATRVVPQLGEIHCAAD